MKALLINPQLPFTFWSHPESTRLAGARTLTPPLGLLTLAALLPREWRFRLCDLNIKPIEEEDWCWADMVMITGMFVQHEGIHTLIEEAKSRGKKTVVGGPYATSMPDAVLAAGCDYFMVEVLDWHNPDVLGLVLEEVLPAMRGIAGPA